MKYLIIISFFFLSPLAHSKTWHNVSMEDQIEIAGQSLQLNGMALRKAVFFQVYVGGLYLKTPSKDSQAIINSQEMKHLNMQFIRSVSRSKIRKGFVKGYDKSCKLHCEKLRKHLEAFNDLIEDMGKNEKNVPDFQCRQCDSFYEGPAKGNN